MPIRLTVSFGGADAVRAFDDEPVAIGRPTDADVPTLDLSQDVCVSRRHALLFCQQGTWWIKDVGSKFGTQVNGREIKDQGDRRLRSGDLIRVGETNIRVESATSPIPVSTEPTPEPVVADRTVKVIQALDTGSTVAVAGAILETVKEHRLSMLCDLPLQFAQETSLDALLSLVVQRVVYFIPAAKRGAVLLRRNEAEPLLLKAFVSNDEPAVSETLARRALAEGRAVIWRRETDPDPTLSIKQLHMETGMYAPLLWQRRPLGVLCVDSPEPGAIFTDEDLRFLMSVSQYAAAAIANYQLQDELRQNAQLLERLLTNFSPKLRGVLLARARLGRLRLGGENSEVTLLLCDLCSFTATSSGMDASAVVEMLNDYLQTLAQVVFQFDGTIDKYIGDSVLAVFGSPEPDPQQCEKAVRAALEMQRQVEEVNQKRSARGDAVCQTAIGVHCGVVFHGFIGTSERLEFTVIGDAVNRTARYCSFAGRGGVLISSEVYQRVFNLVQTEKTTITPKEGDLPAFRVKGLRPRQLA
jgi:adenylate cyclase